MQKALKPNRNNIETYLPIFKGFYGSQWEDIDFFGESECFNLPPNFDFWQYFNQQAYYEALSEYFCDCVESEMSEFVERIDYQRLVSPKEYNFKNDSIDCIIRPRKKAIQTYIYQHKDKFEQYLRDHLTPRSGFIPYHSNQFAEWEENTRKFTRFDKDFDNTGFNLGFVLSFIAENEGLTEGIFDDHYSRVYYSEYYKTEFYELVDTLETNKYINRENFIYARQHGYNLVNMAEYIEFIQEFVRNNYANPNVLTMTVNEWANIETGLCDTLSDYLDILAIAKDQVNAIDSLTPELNLQ